MNLNDTIYSLVNPAAIVCVNKNMEKAIIAYLKNKHNFGNAFVLSPTVRTAKGEVESVYVMNDMLRVTTANNDFSLSTLLDGTAEFSHGNAYDVLYETIGQIAMILDNEDDGADHSVNCRCKICQENEEQHL